MNKPNTKQKYQSPDFNVIIIDCAISLTTESAPSIDPDSSYPSFLKSFTDNNPFHNNNPNPTV